MEVDYEEKSAQKFMVGFLTMLAAGTLPGSAYTVSADSMDFVEYDMTTGAETYFTVTVPGEDTGDFTMRVWRQSRKMLTAILRCLDTRAGLIRHLPQQRKRTAG